VIEALFAGLFGLIFGSFLNVCIYRMPRDLSVARPARSFCPSCEATIAWYDNLPVVSYFYLGGRCRNCRARIPLRYPIVEFATGALFVGFVLWLGPTVEALKYCIFAAIQVALIAMDFEERILADEFTLGGIAIGLLFAAFLPMPPGFFALYYSESWSARVVSLAESAFGAGLLSSVLWSIGALYHRLRGREGLGFGDVKMVGMIGAFLGLGPALLTVVVGSVLGTVCGITYILLRGENAATYELPFGSFLGAGALAVAVWSRLQI
jgi:leader peptidase (prepilin peptidase)/N-methyltransferase